MKRKWLALLAVMLLVLGLSACSSGPEVIEITVLTPEEGAIVDTLNPDVRSYLKNYTAGSSEKYYNRKDNDTTVPVNINWDDVEGIDEYTLVVADNEGFENAAEYTTASSEYNLRNLIGDTRYYFKVKAENDRYICESPVLYFNTEKGPRIITADGIKNIRDIGGMGIKYGMVYRSAQLDGVSIAGTKLLTEELGIRTELDLRDPDEIELAGVSSLGEGINYINIPGVMYLGAMDSAEGRETMAEELRVFANEENYPINVHCVYGRDRTGTLVFTLKALSGVGADDIYKDYELSMLSSGAHTKKSVDECVQEMQKFERRLRGYDGTGNATLEQCAELYVKSCGLTDEEISAIRKMLKN